MVTPAEPFRTASPRFCDDPNVPRYLLPGEERVREIWQLISKTSGRSRLVAALPKNPTTSLAAARLLKEQGSRRGRLLEL